MIDPMKPKRAIDLGGSQPFSTIDRRDHFMDSSPSASPGQSGSTSRGRGGSRGRGNRGGDGKSLRAKGRRGTGRPAEWKQRLTLEGEGPADEEDEEAREAREEMARKYARRQLDSNAERYKEEQPELDSEGEEIKEPEVDLASFLARQRLDDTPRPIVLGSASEPDEDEVDHSLAHLKSVGSGHKPTKGRVQTIEWDEELENMSREKAAADANRDLKSRFRTNAAKQLTTRSTTRALRTQNKGLAEAPPLPTEDHGPKKTEEQEMQEFLDDLLS